MLRRKNLVLGILLAATWILPQSTPWASGGRLPSAARTALMGAIRHHVGEPRAKLKITRNQYQSRKLNSTQQIHTQTTNGNNHWNRGRAYIYNAKIDMPAGKSLNAGKYLIAERQDRTTQEVYWEVRPLAIPLRADGKPSKQSTKQVTRPTSGEGEINIAFINKGSGAVQKSVTGITARGATIASSGWQSGQHTSEILATRVDLYSKTVSYYALGRIERDAAGNPLEGKALVETTVRAEAPPMSTAARSTGPHNTFWRPEWTPVPVKATIEHANAGGNSASASNRWRPPQ